VSLSFSLTILFQGLQVLTKMYLLSGSLSDILFGNLWGGEGVGEQS
jgi:hypothetical protein